MDMTKTPAVETVTVASIRPSQSSSTPSASEVEMAILPPVPVVEVDGVEEPAEDPTNRVDYHSLGWVKAALSKSSHPHPLPLPPRLLL